MPLLVLLTLCSDSHSLLDTTYNAHGSLNLWHSFNSLTFDLSDTRYLVDLSSRKELIDNEKVTMGYDGSEYWVEVHDTSAKTPDPKFMINLQFYFFAMPFVLADDGVILQQLSDAKIADQSFRVIKATFQPQIGVAPKDEYILYLDPATDQLVYLLYSVTYFDPTKASTYSALHYREWQEVSGLLVPHVIDRYAWNNEAETLGEQRGAKTFANVRFDLQAPDPAAFTQRE